MREFALVPGLTKIMNRNDWLKVFHACAQLPDYRELKYASYFLTQDSHIRGEKIYYKKVTLPAGGYEYQVVSHDVMPTDQTNTNGNYELAGYELVAAIDWDEYGNVSKYVERYKTFDDNSAYYYHCDSYLFPGEAPERIDESSVPKGSSVEKFMRRGDWSWGAGHERLYRRTILQKAQGSLIPEKTVGPTYYHIDYSRGLLTALTYVADDTLINNYLYSLTTDVVYIKGHVYYRKTGDNVYTLMTGWKAGDIISNVSTVYHRGDDIWLSNQDILGKQTYGNGYYERTGKRYPYEDFLAVATEATDGYARGGLYKCKRMKYLLTEDSIRNWEKSYFEYHSDTNTYVEKTADAEDVYRLTDGSNFIQTPDTDVFVDGVVYYTSIDGSELLKFSTPSKATPGSKYSSGNVYYKKVVDGDEVRYKRLWENEDYKGDDTIATDDIYYLDFYASTKPLSKYVIGSYISDYYKENSFYPGLRNRTLYWRNGWEFTKVENEYGITTDTKFNFSAKKYYCYKGYGYEFDEINASNVFSIHPDDVFGYETWTKENFDYFGYRRLIEGKDYTVGRAISGTIYVADPDTDIAIDTSKAATGVYLSGKKYWKRDTYLVAEPSSTASNIDTKYYLYDTSAKKVGAAFRSIPVGYIGRSATAVLSDMSNFFIPYETVPTYYYMADKNNASWAAKFAIFPVSKTLGETGYDYYGAKMSAQAETIYTKSTDGTIPLTVDVCVQFKQGLTYSAGDTALLNKDGMEMPLNPTLYTTARAGEALLNDEYYEEATGIYYWDHFYLDKGTSSSSVYDVAVYYDASNIYLSWKDPELMINADDVTAGVDTWYKTTLDFVDSSGTTHQMYVETSRNEYGFSFYKWSCANDRADGNYKIDSAAVSTGTFRITAISRTGMIAPNKLVKAYPIVDAHSSDPAFVNIMSDTALPGLVYYNSVTDEEIYNVEPYVTTLPNFYVKYQEGLPVYEYNSTSGIYKPVDMTGKIGTKIEVADTAKYIRVYTKPEITYAELAHKGDLKRIYSVGDVVTFPVPAQVNMTVNVSGKVTINDKGTANADCMLVDFDHANTVREYEVGYEPVADGATVVKGVEYFVRIGTTTIACTAADNYVYGKIYGLTEGTLISSVIGSETVYQHRSDGVPHYQFYTRTADPDTKKFVYSPIDYTTDVWKDIVPDRTNILFYKDNAYRGSTTGSDGVTEETVAYGEYDDGAKGNVTLAYKDHTLKNMSYILHPDGADEYWNDTCAGRLMLEALTGLVSTENLGIKRCLNTVCSVNNTIDNTSFVGSKVMCKTEDYFWLPSARQIGCSQVTFTADGRTVSVTMPDENGLLDAFSDGSSTRFTINRDIRWTRTIPLCAATFPSGMPTTSSKQWDAVAVDGSDISTAREKAILRCSYDVDTPAYFYAFFTLG